MKHRILPGLALICLIFSVLGVNAQTQSKAPLNEPDPNKPRLFTKLPSELTISVSDIEQLLLPAKTANRSADWQKGDRKISVFTLNYISATSLYENKVHSVLLSLKEFPGATLTLSSSTNADGTVAYAGRIISFQHGDMYELVPAGQVYVLKKRNFHDVVVE